MKTKFSTTVFALVSFLCAGIGQPDAVTAAGVIDVPGPDAYQIGVWDASTRVFSLTTQVQASVRIAEDNLTLDCQGFAISGSGTGSGIVLSGRTGVIVNNGILVNLGIGIELVDSYANIIRNNAVSGVGVGISCTRSNDNVIAENLVRVNRYAGIVLNSSSGNLVTDNTVEEGRAAGILLQASESQTVEGNTVRACNDGINLADSPGNKLTRNLVASNRCSGIVLFDASPANVMDGNTCRENKWGIFLVRVPGSIIISNTCEGNQYGIYLVSANGNSIGANTCRSNHDGIYMRSSSENQLTLNLLEQNTYSGLMLRDSSSQNSVEGNNCLSNNDGLYLYRCEANTLKSNLVDSNTYSGIVLACSSNGNQLEKNIASGNRWGVFCNQSSQNTLTGNTFWENEIGFNGPGGSNGNTLTLNSFTLNGTGVRLYRCNDNQTYNNDFIDNPVPAVVQQSRGNVFSLDRPVGGNFWNTWTEPDDDGDGFVDIPFAFEGGEDGLPVAAPFNAPEEDELIWPEGSALTAVHVGLTKVVLEWTAAEGEVENYILFQDGSAIATLDSDVTYDLAAGLNAGTTYTFTVQAANASFQTTDGPSTTVRTLTPVEAIEMLMQQVIDLGLQPDGITTSLLAKLNTAQKILSDDNEQNDVAAINTLRAFIQHVDAQSGKKIDAADAQSLQEAAMEIIQVLRGA